MAGRPDEGRIGGLGGHADGVGDGARLHLVVAHQTGEDREARRVGRRPAAGPQGVGLEVPDRPRARRRARRAVLGVVELVQGAGGRVDHEGVAVAGRLGPSFYGGGGPERVRARVALRGVLEGDVHQGLGGRHHRVGNAVGGAGVARGTEVRVQVGGGAVHAGHPLGAVGVDRQLRDVRVPHVVGREHGTVRRTRQRGPGRCRERCGEERHPGADHPRGHEEGQDPSQCGRDGSLRHVHHSPRATVHCPASRRGPCVTRQGPTHG